MFLKSEPLKHNGASVTLYELSALQRIEHLEYLKKLKPLKKGISRQPWKPLCAAAHLWWRCHYGTPMH